MTRQTDGKSLYEQQEERILAQSDAFISLLTKRGILGDHQIDNEKVRKAKQEKNRKSYTCREIGEQIGATDKQVAAMVSKARKFLKSRKDVLDLAGNI